MRTKGATSNVGISMAKLKEMFGDRAVIPVARAFAEANHFNVNAKVPKKPIMYVINAGVMSKRKLNGW